MTRNRVKLSRKSKHKKGEASKTVDIDDDQQTKDKNLTETVKSKPEDESHLLDLQKCVKTKLKSAKQVHIAFLPDKYEPLVEDEITDKPQDTFKKKQDKYKKFRKNVGKALRYSWKCLVVGLQNVSMGYSMPLTSVVPEMHRARSYAY